MSPQSRLERYEHRTEWPLAAVAILFLALYSITTVTTGYNDLTPLTVEGRIVAVALMIGGISLIGIVTATLAPWIVLRVAEEDTANQAVTTAQIHELREEIRRLAQPVKGGKSLIEERVEGSG